MGYVKTTNSFSGLALPVKLTGQAELHQGQKILLKNNFNNGQDSGKALSYNCRVAMDVRDVLEAGIVDSEGETWYQNPHSLPQFYKNDKGNVALTFGVISQDNTKKITYRWLDDDIPPEFIQTAVEYDLGERVNPRTILLDFDSATALRPQKNRKSRPEELVPRKRPFKDCQGQPRVFDRPGIDDLKKAKAMISAQRRRQRRRGNS